VENIDVRVSDVTELLYRLHLREFEDHFRRVREYKGWLIWVSALTQCPRRWFYMLRFPEAAKTKVVYEIKTSRSDVGLPYEHRLLQLRIYMNMVNATKGVVFYLTPDRVAEFFVTNPVSDEELKELVEEFLEFLDPKYDWECSYCVYSTICPLKKTVNVKR
jgi:CRISPR/Cas system-associated exonuclease Cas4 (RecB family)